jgi:hypothetical protein
MMFPLMISAAGILTCVLVTLLATDIKPATQISEIESTLKLQLIVSTVLMTPVRTRCCVCVSVCSVCVCVSVFVGIAARVRQCVCAAGLWAPQLGRPAAGLGRSSRPVLCPPPSSTHPPPHPPPFKGRVRHRRHVAAAHLQAVCAQPRPLQGL